MTKIIKSLVVICGLFVLVSTVFILSRSNQSYKELPTTTTTSTLTPTASISNTPILTKTATPQPTNTPTETPTPTATSTFLPTHTKGFYAIPSPQGMYCEVEPLFGNPAPGRDVAYGCFAVSCFQNGTLVYGNEATCLNPWPFEWEYYHPIRETLQY